MKKICDKCGIEVEVLEEGEKPLEIKDIIVDDDIDRAIEAINEE